MICQKKLKSGVRCRDKATARTEIGTPLCDYHYKDWIDKLHSKQRSYYKGVVRRTEEICYFIYLDCSSKKMDLERTIEVMERHTHYERRKIILFLTTSFVVGKSDFLEKYPNWKELLRIQKL